MRTGCKLQCMARYYIYKINPADGDYYCKMEAGKTFAWFHGASDVPDWNEEPMPVEAVEFFFEGTEAGFIQRIKANYAAMQAAISRDAF